MRISLNSAPCGAAKTRALARRAVRLARKGLRVLIVQPTMRLLDQTVSDELDPIRGKVSVKAIHSSTSEHPILDIIAHMAQSSLSGEILLITHAAHMRLPHVPRSLEWVLLYDEAPQAIWAAEHNLPATHRLLTQGFRVEEALPEYDRVVAEGTY